MSKTKKRKAVTPGQRFYEPNKVDVAKNSPEKRLTTFKHNKKGRNTYGRITSRRRGGGHKRKYRIIDFKRNKFDIPATVKSIEYDPNRSANIALLAYADGEKRYILAPEGVSVGTKLISTNNPVAEFEKGMSLPLKNIPPSTMIHAIELLPGKGAQMARGAGAYAQLISIDGPTAVIKLPSGEIRKVHSDCRATVGVVGNSTHSSRVLGKAGRKRWLGRRPRVRGVAMNPVDHPMGGGEGRTSGGGHPCSPWGQLSKSFPTRQKSKTTNNMILTDRKGKKRGKA